MEKDRSDSTSSSGSTSDSSKNTQIIRSKMIPPVQLNPASLDMENQNFKKAMVIAAERSKRSPATFVELDVKSLDKLFEQSPRRSRLPEIIGAFP
ncbi:hypothetical protein FO519_002826 [Halicephalobus sp. NKZ332]|nr:hypothetical protein FO519_002826 [Halicephalobus sp. NKZ332]